jgi:protease inhibitor Inh
MTSRQTLATLGATLALTLGGAVQAMTPALLDPAAIAGTWTLARTGGATCTLTLKADPSSYGRGHALELGSCADVAGISAARYWQVSSDGIRLSGEESTVIFLSSHGPDAFRTSGKSSLDVGGEWTLTRARP